MTISTFENLEGEMVEVDVEECQNFADTITSDVMDFHQETGDFYTVAVCLIYNILDVLKDNDMSDDHLLDFMLEFVKKGECH